MARKKGKRAKGEGSLRERSDGRWEARITVDTDVVTGKLIFKSFYGKTQGEALQKKKDYEAQVATDNYVASDKVTFGDYIKNWLELYKKPLVRESTYSKYLINVNKHIIPELGRIQVQKLSRDHIQNFYNKKAITLSSSVVTILHQLTSAVLRHAVEKDSIIKINPADGTQKPPVTYKEIEPFTTGEAIKYLNMAKSHRLYPAFLLALYSGLREGELLGLRWRDIDFENKVLYVRRSLTRVMNESTGKTELKTGKLKTKRSKRDIPLNEDVLDVLKLHEDHQQKELDLLNLKLADKDKYVFLSTNGTPIDRRNFLRIHKKLLKDFGLRQEIRVHDLRHTFGTLLAQSGENPNNIQNIMGHEKISTTLETYCHSNSAYIKGTVDRLANILKP